jgi:hypothetical protein
VLIRSNDASNYANPAIRVMLELTHTSGKPSQPSLNPKEGDETPSKTYQSLAPPGLSRTCEIKEPPLADSKVIGGSSRISTLPRTSTLTESPSYSLWWLASHASASPEPEPLALTIGSCPGPLVIRFVRAKRVSGACLAST